MEYYQNQLLNVDSLIPYVGNSRTHSDEQVAQIAASIREFGFTNPLLVDENNNLIAGHGRLMAARKLGLTDVPAVIVTGLSPERRRALIIADNKLALNAGWDIETLSSELADLAPQYGELMGFDEDELAALLSKATDGNTNEDDIPEAPIDPITQLGDVWLLGNHRLVCGDCTDPGVVDSCLNGVKPHLMVTDPPYGVEYDPKWRSEAGINKNKNKMGEVVNDHISDWSNAWSLFDGDIAYVWHADKHAAVVQQSLEKSGFEIRCQIIWAKDRFALSRGDYHWQHEPCWYAVRKNARGNWNGDRKQTTLWNIPAREDGGLGHGTQKPVECMRRPIVNNSSPGQAVYEPFSGSGTTIIACENTGRICHAIEINPVYVDVAVKRWMQYAGQTAVLEINGQPFKLDGAA